MISNFSRPTLVKAAESMFTAQGLDCPVTISESNGTVLIINRNIYNAANTATEKTAE